VRWVTAIFIVGLALGGATAIPIESQLDLAARWAGVPPPGVAGWLAKVREGVKVTQAQCPFMAYGTDWLAFGHFAIALLFMVTLSDPARNIALYRGGMVVCALVIPFALGFGALRGIPLGWRLIDCCFGVGGFVPLWLCHRWLQRCGAAG
jgi:hypothetical protein